MLMEAAPRVRGGVKVSSDIESGRGTDQEESGRGTAGTRSEAEDQRLDRVVVMRRAAPGLSVGVDRKIATGKIAALVDDNGVGNRGDPAPHEVPHTVGVLDDLR